MTDDGINVGMPPWKIAGQEQLLPGASIEQRWELARSAGLDGIELRARSGEALEARFDVLHRAVGRGVVLPSVCLDVLPLAGDAERGAEALGQMSSRLGPIAALGVGVVVVPVSGTRRVPVPRSSTEDPGTLLDGLRLLSERAAREGVSVCLQPVNRYEGDQVNTLAQAAELCRAVGVPSARVAASTFHMNIEEADPAVALLAAGPWLGHVALADSNGLEPGAGHVDFAAVFAALDAGGYRGWTSLACRLSGPDVLPAAVGVLRQAGG
ncbi:sugar phosphate isomerase/epimerase family protein [Actinosynnema sp. NPDC023658]|uniref:sugar phosphate isomerase/epimerase family protein n=1 Tax=Actinosynnema sp. NPDC023658 TaxID=3155465 RepID=UPI0033D4E90B